MHQIDLKPKEVKQIWDAGCTVTNTSEVVQQSGISKYKHQDKYYYCLGSNEPECLFVNLKDAIQYFFVWIGF